MKSTEILFSKSEWQNQYFVIITKHKILVKVLGAEETRTTLCSLGKSCNTVIPILFYWDWDSERPIMVQAGETRALNGRVARASLEEFESTCVTPRATKCQEICFRSIHVDGASLSVKYCPAGTDTRGGLGGHVPPLNFRIFFFLQIRENKSKKNKCYKANLLQIKHLAHWIKTKKTKHAPYVRSV